MWTLLYFYLMWMIYFKLGDWGLYHPDFFKFIPYFLVFMTAKNFLLGLLRRVFSFMRTRDWLKHRKWENKKMKMEQHIYTQKYQEFVKQEEFLKQQELSNTNEIKEIDYEHESK